MGVVAAIVLYRCSIRDSKTIQSLEAVRRSCDRTSELFHPIIYDNGPVDQSDLGVLPSDLGYHFSSLNQGVSGAYNEALKTALAQGHEWLLLLDQDTFLPETFLDDLFQAIGSLSPSDNVAAIVPKILSGGNLVSPSRAAWSGILRPIPRLFEGICHFRVTAIGSGAVVSVPFMAQIGGFSREFWLDYLDQ